MERKVNIIDQNREQELHRAMELFMFAYRAFTAEPDRMLEERGLQRVHHRILYFVGRNPGISVNGLLGILAVSKQALNAPLRQLLGMELVEAQAPESDRRVRELRLTEKGKRLESALSKGQCQMLEAVFREVGKTAEAAWRDAMGRIAGD